mmetsp:Transcript_119249/g.380140  ORF Transcript_119249/g.380140 Transcript_119249/m.380140 type:complete len:286 (+) Transcript_119249:54-911(+)
MWHSRVFDHEHHKSLYAIVGVSNSSLFDCTCNNSGTDHDGPKRSHPCESVLPQDHNICHKAYRNRQVQGHSRDQWCRQKDSPCPNVVRYGGPQECIEQHDQQCFDGWHFEWLKTSDLTQRHETGAEGQAQQPDTTPKKIHLTGFDMHRKSIRKMTICNRTAHGQCFTRNCVYWRVRVQLSFLTEHCENNAGHSTNNTYQSEKRAVTPSEPEAEQVRPYGTARRQNRVRGQRCALQGQVESPLTDKPIRRYQEQDAPRQAIAVAGIMVPIALATCHVTYGMWKQEE